MNIPFKPRLTRRRTSDSRMIGRDLSISVGSMPTHQGEWHKSTYSGMDGCVECRETSNGVEVRDSKDPMGPILRFSHHEWGAFTRGVRHDEFDYTRN